MNHDSRRTTLVAGADGCRAGWICVTADAESTESLALEDVAVLPDFEALLAHTRGCAALAVDIPIGLSPDGPRLADTEARRRIGPRRSSVFPVPPRSILRIRDYPTANSISKERFGRGLQKQTFYISPKIEQADDAMRPEMQVRIVEAHPEVCFWALGGKHHVPFPKRSSEGRSLRLGLLESLYGPSIREVTPPRGAGWDDLYDAIVLVWTATRVAAGCAVHMPPDAERDERGLLMEIVY